MKKIVLFLALIIVVMINFKEESVIIPINAIRFRVIANSNTLEDQTIKNQISIELEKYIYNLIKNANSSEETKEILNKNQDQMKNFVGDFMKKNKINKSYELAIGQNYFPAKEYKGIKYDAGYYDSVVLNLGNARGVNWWCVIYPPLCLINEEKNDVEYTTLAQELLNRYHV